MARRLAKSTADAERVAAVREQLIDGMDWLQIALADDAGDGNGGDGGGGSAGVGAGMPDDRTREEKAGAFLRALAQTFSVSAACDRARISRDTAYRWRKEDGRFAALWEMALTRCVEQIEETMFQKAIGGSFLDGIALLKGARPEKYRDNAPIAIPQPAVTSIRFMSEREHQAAIETEYRIVAPQLPAHVGEGE